MEDENLEEICYTQRNLVSALCLDDYVCPWVKPDQHKVICFYLKYFVMCVVLFKNFQESDADLVSCCIPAHTNCTGVPRVLVERSDLRKDLAVFSKF